MECHAHTHTHTSTPYALNRAEVLDSAHKWQRIRCLRTRFTITCGISSSLLPPIVKRSRTGGSPLSFLYRVWNTYIRSNASPIRRWTSGFLGVVSSLTPLTFLPPTATTGAATGIQSTRVCARRTADVPTGTQMRHGWLTSHGTRPYSLAWPRPLIIQLRQRSVVSSRLLPQHCITHSLMVLMML